MPESAVKSSSIVTPNATRWHQRVGAWLIYALIKIVTATLRIRWIDRSGWLDAAKPGPAVYCVWHNRLALSMSAYYGYVRRRNQSAGLVALVSASKDGGLLAGALECFGVQPVRGSSSRRGPQALRELTTWAKRGYDIAITPDGPRGPRYRVQEGVIALAQVAEMTLIPVNIQMDWKIQMRSWDRFQIPLPFSRCEIVFGKPFFIPREATDAARETLRRQLEPDHADHVARLSSPAQS